MQNTQNLRLWLDDLTLDLVYVAGTGNKPFMMGGTTWSESSLPVHPVHLSPFYIGQFPVTQALWQKVMGANPAYFQGDTNRPVESVSWEMIRQKGGFLERLNALMAEELKKAGLENGRFMLPSEAQWEYAARGGKHWQDDFRYAGSNNLHEVAWYSENSHRETKPLGLKKPNQLGIYDMSGNVWEWCEDDYDENFYKNNKNVNNPIYVIKKEYKVCRGGSWYDGDSYGLVCNRGWFIPISISSDLGFRLLWGTR